MNGSMKYAVYKTNKNRKIRIDKNAWMYDLDRILYDSIESARADIISENKDCHTYHHYAVWLDNNGKDEHNGSGIVIGTASGNFYYEDYNSDQIYRLDENGIADTSRTYEFLRLE